MKQQQIKSNLRSKLRWGVVGIFALLVFSAAFDVPEIVNRGINTVNSATGFGLPHIPAKPFSLGLDLQGGAHLTYKADVQNIDTGDKAAAVEGVRDVIERRVTGLGVGEPSVQTSKVDNDYRILVDLPGVTDVNTAIKMIGETPILEFKEVNNEPARDLTPEQKKQLETQNAEAKKKAESVLKRVQKGEDFGKLAAEFSNDDATKNNSGYMGFLGSRIVERPIYDWAKTARPSSTSRTLVSSSDGYNILQRGAERNGDKEMKASHILICYHGLQNCPDEPMSKDEALAKANQVYTEANAKNFAELAKKYSADPGSKDKGGDLGTFPRGLMVKSFEDAVFAAQVGQIIGPVESEFGYHIIYKTGEVQTKEYEVSRILVRTKTKDDILPPKEDWKYTGLSGKQLKKAEVVTSQTTGEVQVSLQFDDEGRDLFKTITEKNIGKPVAIFLDGQIISYPTVQSVIPDGRAVISGSFTLKDAQLLSQRLNAGALPVPVELISQQTVGASLGADSLQKSLHAGLVAVALVMIFMVVLYRLPGVVAVIGLLVYISLSGALFKLLGVTLSLAGIAGFILSIGMAVDANILVFERMKEELRAGRSLRGAVEEGFLRAWTSIRDGNTSTLITCVILIWFGSSFVKGFAVTLTLGIVVSIFTAITVTRTLLRFIIPWFGENGHWLLLSKRQKSEDTSTIV